MQPTRALATIAALTLLLLSLAAGTVPSIAPAPATTQPSDNAAIKVALQERKTWTFADPAPVVTFDNTFSGARVNDCTQVGPHEFKILVTPENEPINPSPWYAFRVKASAPVEITVRLAIATAKSRPRARISEDGIRWKRVDDADWKGESGAPECVLKLKVGPKPVWVASNHMVSVDQLWAWTDALARKPGASMRTIGQSIAGRPIKLVEVDQGAPANYVIIIGRQHPPEVTGSIGLMAFMDRVMDESEISSAFRKKFRVVTVPLVNPDGVHEGQWRSTLGAVDSNRDWHDFSQPETTAVRDAILAIQKRPDTRLFLLLDFHTTSKDIFYLPPDSAKTFPPSFSRRWVDAIQARFPDYEVESSGSHNVDQWTFKRWAFETTGAPGITYELGSGTSPAKIERIVQGAADEAIRLLMESADAPRSEGPFPPKPDTIVEVKPSGRPAVVGP
ncbi:MAG: peptidase M14 [Planctomycetes bacterium]|nr:peptidase M14 [Planctomycetota bacterium]